MASLSSLLAKRQVQRAPVPARVEPESAAVVACSRPARQVQRAPVPARVEPESAAVVACSHPARRLYRAHLSDWGGLFDLTTWECCADCGEQRLALVRSFSTRAMADTEYGAALEALRENGHA